METKHRVTQQSSRSGYLPTNGNGNGYAPVASYDDETGTAEEVVEEVAGASEASEATDYGAGATAEATTVDDATGHRPISSPVSRSTSASGENGMSDESAAETDTESTYESVEGWQESQSTEADAETEPVIEASYADVESTGNEEFFGILAGILLPLAKAVLPTLAGAAVKQGGKLVKSIVRGKKPRLSPAILQMLRQQGVNPLIIKQLELGEESDGEAMDSESDATDETSVEALAQQIEALEVVIGADDRVQVQNTTAVPWKRICHLRIQAANGKLYLGTGFFIGPRTILTAGHCVYIHGQGGWPRQIVVTPGRNAASTPFNPITATAFRSVQGWVNGKSRNYDYGVIQLPKNASVSPSIGSFGFGQFPDQFLLDKRLNTAGYPGDKPAGTMWFNGRKAKAVTSRTITYDLDTAGGQSGSPVWFKDPAGRRVVVGIHTNGASSGNSATRITKPVFDNLKKWRNEGSSMA
ncbi:trypsin-like peptidase domain-containing protein [Hymenobacter aerophilus]|uniref:trypsin-like peptidase domain-containing protein n=1 Tax=Hymenobacter aerophilus TaxID=119644 RepID=UPI0003663E1E|nr:trypsin-like peptidase domain-containing protein [Hymenobacter aerophilus]